MSYKDKVQGIKDFPWYDYQPLGIVMMSLVSAKEFAESLKCALRAYPNDQNLLKMADGELNTDNLRYGSWCHADDRGDHWQFLDHFLKPYPLHTSFVEAVSYGAPQAYLDVVKSMTDKERAMTVFSREQELPGIFDVILISHPWEQLGLGFYQYYLERHIELDSGEDGHGELTSAYQLDPVVLDRFYTARLEMYQSGLELLGK